MDGSGKEKGRTDNAPIRPVSSLLSHFEGLAHSRSPSAAATPHESALKAPADEPPRSSLDLPPRSARDSSPDPGGQQHDHTNGEALRPGLAGVSGGHARPTSMGFQSPQLGPTLTVDSPLSPPRGGAPTSSPGNRHDADALYGSENASRESLASERAARGHFQRPTSPRTAITAAKPVGPQSKERFTPSTGKQGGETEDPRETAKPAAPRRSRSRRSAGENGLGGKSVALQHAAKQPGEVVVETATALGRRVASLAPSPSRIVRPGTEPPGRRSFDDRPPAPDARALQDAREIGFARRRPGPGPSQIEKPLMVQIPPAQPHQPEPMSGASSAAPRRQAADTPRERPELPPRQLSLPPRRSPVSPSRAQHADGTATPTIRTELAEQSTGDTQSPSQVRRQSSVSREPRPPETPSYPDRQPSRAVPEEEEQTLGEAPLRSDYPDASQANRRPPHLKTGPKEIHTRYDTRLLDACGRFVCTTGYLTRVWDVTTGEQVMSLSHGETVKSLSLSFKPGKSLEEEGQRIWLGTSAGELLEVDIQTQSVVTSRSYPSRREVIKILRNKKEMWTIDDEGRLLVWPPDESGVPNLQYSYYSPHERVARNQTFSMVVGAALWLATGKDVQVYRPNARDDHSFKVLKKPLGSQHSGEVTSGTYTSKEGGRVYLGHADGKVTVYSPVDYSCLAVVNVSVYKINCLGIVGDYLWAAYKTGMIYVYDTGANPWVIKKDWRAHDSPVSAFLLDTSSVWTMNRLQVTSLGTDNCIRLWDGMLEDDWLESQMQSRDVQFCSFREIRAVIVTWNAGASTPGSVRTTRFIEDAINPENPPEIVVFGFQELVDLENKKITAKSLLRGSKKKESGEKEHMSRQYRVWIEHLTRSINECMPLEEAYVLLHTANLVGLFTCVFVKHRERQRVKSVNASEVKRGMGGLHGNKGALVLRFVLDDTSMCFINCHLAAGQTQTAHRNNDIAAILETESLPLESSLTTRADHFVSGGDGSMIMDHEICILNGDLNYRIDSIPRNVIIEDIRNNNLPKLLERDQLLASRRKNPGFRLRSFNEATITFAPTYKYDVGTDDYDSSEKKRSPAWCDRVLYRGFGTVKQVEYRRHEVRASDHRPVSAMFKMRVKTVQPKERAATWEVCQQEFQKERQRLASEASIEYLINVLGTEPQQARSLFFGAGKR
ncbi:inositol polyphosphate phosphatase [Aspergillus sp. HF37]|nr:inositol polyphosphate phosphatase [Aspergillus sp. HF37]